MSSEELSTRLRVLEIQVQRIVSDIESEKATRSRANAELGLKLDKLDDNQRRMERMIWLAAGALAVLQYLVPLVTPFLKQ